MINCLTRFLPLAAALLAALPSLPQAARTVINVRNDLPISRPSETIVLTGKELSRIQPLDDLRRIRVTDAASGKELVSQAVDLDDDSAPEELVFQADFAPGQSRRFVLSVGSRRIPAREEFRVYGRFARERYDDFAWENDRIAHRMYGTALETWEKEPLTSSAVDVWCKRTRRLVINDWYMVDNYHEDTGEGADFYSAGKSRGCGGSGLWQDGRLHVSKNFVNSKVLANGPIRLVFELTYASWRVGDREVSEIKRITLDAGQNLDRFESFYRAAGASDLAYAVGIKKGEGSAVLHDRKEGWLRTWEPVRKGQSGNLGCGIVLDPGLLTEITEADGNYLIVARTDSRQVATYYAGFGWDRSGDFADAAAWTEYLQQAARRLRSPLKISVEGGSRE